MDMIGDSNRIKYIIFLLIKIIFISSFTFGQKQQTFSKIDSSVKDLGNNFIKSPQSVGLSIGIYNNGKSYFYNFGTIEKGKTSAPTQNTLYEIGSITKTFAGYLLAMAVSEKKANLDDDVRKYLDGPYPNLELEGQPVRLVHLANTTAGIPEWIPSEPEAVKQASPDEISALKIKIYGKYSRKDFFEALRLVKLESVPGTVRKHSNGGGQLLAYVLEDIYKMAFEKLVEKYIFNSTGMKNTFFTVPAGKMKLLATGYNSNGNPVPYMDIPYFRSMGGLKSTAEDMVKYIERLLSNKNPIAKLANKATVDVNIQTNKVIGPSRENEYDPSVFSSGLNWLTYRPEKGNIQRWTDGGTTGFNTYLVLYPEIKSGIIVLANKSDETTFKALPGIAYKIFQAMNNTLTSK